MQIIHNFGLRSKFNPEQTGWLDVVLDKVKALSQKDFVLRLYGIPGNSLLTYKLVNGCSKTYSLIYRKANQIYVEVFTKALPDPEHFIKPAFNAQALEVFEASDEGLEQASIAIQEAMDQDTPYSLGEVTKVKVYRQSTDIPWTFVGGRISAIEELSSNEENQIVRVYVDGNKTHYDIALKDTLDKRVAVLKYIVFNDKGEFQTIHSDEFDAYFELVDAPAK